MKRLAIWAFVLSTFAANAEAAEIEETAAGVVAGDVTAVGAELPVSKSGLGLQVRPFLGIGGALLFESANDRRYQTSVVPPLVSVGARVGRVESASMPLEAVWSFRLEFASAETRDGNPTISLLRKRESWLLWVSRDLGRAQGWVPYVAFAAGASRRNLETVLGDQIEAVSGGWLGTASGAAGLRAHWSRLVTAKLEFRYELGDAQSFAKKTSDARMGVAAIIETSF